jgi:hypothetical protein
MARVSLEDAMHNTNPPKRVSREDAMNPSYKKKLEDMTALDFRDIASKVRQNQAMQHLQSVKNQVKIVLQFILDAAERGELVTTYNPELPLMKETVEILKQKHNIAMVIGTNTGEGTRYTMSIKADDSPFYP